MVHARRFAFPASLRLTGSASTTIDLAAVPDEKHRDRLTAAVEPLYIACASCGEAFNGLLSAAGDLLVYDVCVLEILQKWLPQDLASNRRSPACRCY